MSRTDRSSLATGARFSLRQLEAFRAVAATGSIVRAAEELDRTPSAISMALRELQHAMGTDLLQRSGRAVVLTSAGERVLPQIDELLLRAMDLPQRALDTPGRAQRLAIGASRTIGSTLMPELITAFRREHRGARIQLVIGNTDEVLSRIVNLELEAAFVEGAVLDPGIDREVWLRDELVFFVRSGHPLLKQLQPLRRAQVVRVRAADLAAWPWALRERHSGTREVVLRAASVIGRIEVGIETTDNEAIKQLVMRDDWIGCLSRRVVADEFTRGRLIELTVSAPAVRRALRRDLLLVQDPQRYRGDAISRFIDFARRWAKSQAQA